MLNEVDIMSNRRFSDVVAYGGWDIDNHVPGGLLAFDKIPSEVFPFEGSYDIPYRSYLVKGYKNLFVGGRCMGASKLAMASIDTCVTLAKKQLDEFMTIAEIATLTNRKNSAIVELNSYCDQKSYTAENWNIILGIIQSASDEIKAYGTISQIDEKVSTVKASLDAIEKVKDTSSSNDKNRGCSSALDIGGIGVIVALLGMAITILIVKNKKQRF